MIITGISIYGVPVWIEDRVVWNGYMGNNKEALQLQAESAAIKGSAGPGREKARGYRAPGTAMAVLGRWVGAPGTDTLYRTNVAQATITHPF